jgi:hypothetical protein
MDKWEEYKKLLNEFDFVYMYSDDHKHWKKHSAISKRVNELYHELKIENKDLADSLYAEAENNLTVK